MADYYGVNTTKVIAGTGGSNWVATGSIKTTPKVWYDSYELSAVAAGKTIEVARLPVGAKILDFKMAWDDLGSSVTLALGDSTTADRYMAATAANAAGNSDAIKVDGMGYVTGTADDDEKILITTAGATATGTVKVAILYTDGDKA